MKQNMNQSILFLVNTPKKYEDLVAANKQFHASFKRAAEMEAKRKADRDAELAAAHAAASSALAPPATRASAAQESTVAFKLPSSDDDPSGLFSKLGLLDTTNPITKYLLFIFKCIGLLNPLLERTGYKVIIKGGMAVKHVNPVYPTGDIDLLLVKGKDLHDETLRVPKEQVAQHVAFFILWQSFEQQESGVLSDEYSLHFSILPKPDSYIYKISFLTTTGFTAICDIGYKEETAFAIETTTTKVDPFVFEFMDKTSLLLERSFYIIHFYENTFYTNNEMGLFSSYFSSTHMHILMTPNQKGNLHFLRKVYLSFLVLEIPEIHIEYLKNFIDGDLIEHIEANIQSDLKDKADILFIDDQYRQKIFMKMWLRYWRVFIKNLNKTRMYQVDFDLQLNWQQLLTDMWVTPTTPVGEVKGGNQRIVKRKTKKIQYKNTQKQNKRKTRKTK